MATMKKEFIVRSNIHDYQALFVKSFSDVLQTDISKSSAIIIDQNVRDLYNKDLDSILNNTLHFVLDAKETNKSISTIKKIVIFLIENGFKKSHSLIAIGGGITQDVTCFIASTLFRGSRWMFYPTTLLAQCDSCIGSKSSINVGQYKNQLGTFYPPEKVVIDVNFVNTLAHNDILSGLGEAIKVHYLDELKRYETIFKNYNSSLKNFDILAEIIYDSLMIKKRVIEIDEYDNDYRNIMNYGHTFGHALESVCDYQIPHGVAVTIGIGIANNISKTLGYLSSEDHEKMEILVKENTSQVNYQLNDLSPYWKALQMDKKNTDQDIQCILTKGFGCMFKHKISLDESLKSMIVEYLASINMLV